MILGVSFNIFDGMELLPYALKNIRPCVQHVSVVYQNTSNLGNISDFNALEALTTLKEKGLIDEIYLYVPNINLRGHGNELNKRNIGLSIAKRNGCTHFMSMDCDEFYKESELEFAKSVIEDDDYDTSACQMRTFYKSPTYSITPAESYFVPLISKIDERDFYLGVKWPIVADPTRKLEPKKLLSFTREKIEMYHYSYVRKNIRVKLNNSSANTNWKNKIEYLADYYDNWKFPEKALLAGTENRFYDVIECENIFDIML